MRIVGHRQTPPISFAASQTLLTEGARFNDQMNRLPSGNDSFVPKGVYRVRTHAEANRHQQECLARGMAALALDRDIADRVVPERAPAVLSAHSEKP